MKRNLSSYRLLDQLETLPSWVLLAATALLYIPLAFLGYGSDSDSLGVVRTGQYFIASLDYIPSRLPGFFVHEVFVFFLNLLGGSLLSNLGTVLMALLTLFSFRRICVHYQVPRAAFLTLLLMIQPFFWVNAASTIDYLWALGFCFFGFDLLLQKKYLPAVIALALAIGCRLSTIMLVGLILIFLLLTQREQHRQLITSAAGVALLSFIFFLPPLDFLEWDMSRWLVLSTGDPALWTPLLRSGRFFYKNLMFFSLPVVIWGVVVSLITALRRNQPIVSRQVSLSWLALAVILGVEMMFLRVPIEMEYLLPLLPFVLMLVGKVLPDKPGLLWLLLFFTLLANFIWINPARSITPNQTSQVIFGLWLEPGYLLQDITARLTLLSP